MAVLLQINSGIIGSTGTIMLAIDQYAKEAGFETYMASVKNKSSEKDYPSNHIVIGTILEKHFHRNMAAITGNEGGYSYFATKRFLKTVDRIKPNIIQIHNLHWDYINIELLFTYLKGHPEIKVVWTLHDCWALTGHCPHYEMIGCDKWKSYCHDCPIYRAYPKSFLDNSFKMHKRKKLWFLNLPNIVLVTPSLWLNGEVKKSYLKNYTLKIINNGIDIDTFSRKESDFRSIYKLEDKFIILGSAFTWLPRKGFDCFISLSTMMDSRFAIVMIGSMSDEEKRECESSGILCLPRISSKEELARIYSASDVFFNPTREEMFGLTNIEAEACGIPVITFNSGGSPECIGEGCGFVIEKDNLENVVSKLLWLYENKANLDRNKIRNWACKFDANLMYNKYIDLYKELLKEG